MSNSHKLGKWGEEMALHFLKMCGYKCLNQRFRKQTGEIDLIVRRGQDIVFVEVKTRGQGSLDRPEAWVDTRKINHMKKTARHWIAENPVIGPCNFRFDVVSVSFEGHDKGMDIRHFAGIT